MIVFIILSFLDEKNEKFINSDGNIVLRNIIGTFTDTFITSTSKSSL